MSTISAQHTKLIINYSEKIAVFDFLKKLSPQDPRNNAFKTLFNNSSYNNETNNKNIAMFNSLLLDYEYPYKQYPKGQKIEGSTEYILKLNLFKSESYKDFLLRSVGIIPMNDLVQLSEILESFTPIYRSIIYEPFGKAFEDQLIKIKQQVQDKNISALFEKTKQFYQSSWNTHIPFYFSFYPLPTNTGFTATAFANLAVSGIPSTLKDYNIMLCVMLHEIAHIVCDEQPLSFKKDIDNWFSHHPSKYAAYANGLVQESWATAVANGYFHEQLTGELSKSSWYGRKYNDSMARKFYPMVKEYLDASKPMDKELVDGYIKIYETNFPHWENDLNYLLTGRAVISENTDDFKVLNKLFPYRSVTIYDSIFSEKTLENLKESNATRMIILSEKNRKDKITLIKQVFPELTKWKPDFSTEFIFTEWLSDKRKIIIAYPHKSSLESLLKKF